MDACCSMWWKTVREVMYLRKEHVTRVNTLSILFLIMLKPQNIVIIQVLNVWMKAKQCGHDKWKVVNSLMYFNASTDKAL